MVTLLEAAESTIPFAALPVNVIGVVRHPDARTAELSLQLNSKNLNWLPENDRTNSANLAIAAVSLSDDEKVVASRIENMTLSAEARQSAKGAEGGFALYDHSSRSAQDKTCARSG